MNDTLLAEVKCEDKIYDSTLAEVALPRLPQSRILIPTTFPGSLITEESNDFQHLDAIVSASSGSSLIEISSNDSNLGASVMNVFLCARIYPCATHILLTTLFEDDYFYFTRNLRVLLIDEQYVENLQEVVDAIGGLFLEKLSLTVTDRVDLTPLNGIKEVTLRIAEAVPPYENQLFECDFVEYIEAPPFVPIWFDTPVKRLRCGKETFTRYPLHLGHSVVMGEATGQDEPQDNHLYSYEGPAKHFNDSCLFSSVQHLRLAGSTDDLDAELIFRLKEVSIFTATEGSAERIEDLLFLDLYELGIGNPSSIRFRGYPSPTLLRLNSLPRFGLPPVHSLEVRSGGPKLNWDKIPHVLRLKVPYLPKEIPWQLEYLGVPSVEETVKISQLPCDRLCLKE